MYIQNSQQIAISRIADLLSHENLILLENDIWKKVFYNAGEIELFNKHKFSLKMKEVSNGWDSGYEHNDRSYSALQEMLSELILEPEKLNKVLSSIASKINKNYIFSEDINNKLKISVWRSGHFDIIEHLKNKDLSYRLDILDKYPSSSFKSLRNNLNLLGLDFTFDGGEDVELILIPFSSLEGSKDKTLITEWLSKKHLNILGSYESALKAWGNGDDIGTLQHCRNVITGIFLHSIEVEDEDKKKWVAGLQVACKMDKNIMNIEDPGTIKDLEYKLHSKKPNEQYKYPRFKLIYHVYSYLSSLGSHANEGPKVNGVPNCEEANSADALLGLRMTEEVLIWLYKNQYDYKELLKLF